MLHDTLLPRELILLVGSFLIGVEPITRCGGNTSIRFFTRGASRRTIGLVVEIVEVDLLLGKGTELTVISLLEDV